jgi:Glyoxalase/Bleomycin resistance protein/Dioxygenase superfamily
VLKLTHIARVDIPVRDRDEAIAFYTETLGFSLVVDTPFGDGKRWVEVAPPRGGATVALTKSAEILDRGRLTGIVLRSADPRSDHATLKAAQSDVSDLIGGDGTAVLSSRRKPQPPDGHRGPVGDALSTRGTLRLLPADSTSGRRGIAWITRCRWIARPGTIGVRWCADWSSGRTPGSELRGSTPLSALRRPDRGELIASAGPPGRVDLGDSCRLLPGCSRERP